MKKTVASRQNPLFKRVREAIREHKDEIVLEGPKPIADAIASGWKPIAVITRGASPLEHSIAFSDELFDALAETKTPQSMIGLFERPRSTATSILAKRDTVAIALDAVQDPGNVGTIVRLAAAFDVAGVLLLPGCADAYGPKAIRSSVGAILHVPVARMTHDELIDGGAPLYAADAAGDIIDPPARGAVLVFGNEGAGVSDQLLRHSTRIAIPTSARVESLNVAASAAILLSRSFATR